MNRIKQFILPVCFLSLSAIITVLGFSYLGYIQLPGMSVFEGIIGSADVTKSNDELISELVALHSSPLKKTDISDDMRGIWVDAADYVFADDASDEEIKSVIYSDFNYYRNFIPDTVFINFPTSTVFAGSNKFDVIKYTLFCAELIGCDRILVADEELLNGKKGNIDSSEIDNLLNSYQFNGVLFSCEELFGKEDYYNYFLSLKKYIELHHPSIPLGIEVNTDTKALFADEYTIKVFEEIKPDFIYVDCAFTVNDAEFPFALVAMWWNSFAAHYNVPIYCEHRTDLIFTSEKWNDSKEISEQMKILYGCPAFDGSCFYDIVSIKNKKVLARDLSIFLNDVSGELQDSMSVNTLQIADNSVIFTGFNDENYEVFCNDTLVSSVDGSFSVSYPFTSFENEFDFRCAGARYKYLIKNNISLFSSFYPSSDIALEKNKTITVYSISPVGAKVFAVVNGMYYELAAGGVSVSEPIPDGYSVFSGVISFDGARISDGRLTLLCLYDDVYSTVECGNISGGSFFSETSSESDGVLLTEASPYNDNGLGQSLMCVTNSDNTEIISDVKEYDTYHPYRSQLLRGTLDYVDKISVSDEGYLVYELRSGNNIYGVDATLINNAYTMPLNEIELIRFDSSSDRTDFIFDMKWLSPVTVTPEKQDYKKGYLDFSFNIEKFDAEYFDIMFNYCGSLDIPTVLTFTEDSVFSSYELFTAEDNVFIMRLYLRSTGKFHGFDIAETEDGNVKVSFINKKSSSLEGKTVMLDPGHGGLSMVGTALRDNSVSEATVTLALADNVRRYLESRGAKVIMTRDRDTSLSLYERTVMCENANPDIFVSIHCDGSEAAYESGTHTFYFTPFSHFLASSIHSSLVNAYSDRIYVEADENYERIDRKIKYYPFYVTRVDNCPSVLVETGFLTNFVEGNVLANPVNQDILGKAIADGIENYFNNAY